LWFDRQQAGTGAGAQIVGLARDADEGAAGLLAGQDLGRRFQGEGGLDEIAGGELVAGFGGDGGLPGSNGLVSLAAWGRTGPMGKVLSGGSGPMSPVEQARPGGFR
jgi:hypothetical protein